MIKMPRRKEKRVGRVDFLDNPMPAWDFVFFAVYPHLRHWIVSRAGNLEE